MVNRVPLVAEGLKGAFGAVTGIICVEDLPMGRRAALDPEEEPALAERGAGRLVASPASSHLFSPVASTPKAPTAVAVRGCREVCAAIRRSHQQIFFLA